MALSTYLPLSGRFHDGVAANATHDALRLPVFMAHGSLDPMLPIGLGQASRQLLEQAGYRVEWHEYPMAHAVCAEENDDIRHWLIRVLSTDA
jgi:phospholipase/carboxylesterase